jgi:hypothetical protein
VADWDRSHAEAHAPTAAQVYGELGFGCLAAFVASFLGALVTLVAAGLLSGVPGSDPFVSFVGMSVFGIGVTQWLWLGPLVAVLFRRRRAVALGLAIGGVILTLLNGTCLSLVVSA